eukprot:3659709-Rhodomonas_salina.1
MPVCLLLQRREDAHLVIFGEGVEEDDGALSCRGQGCLERAYRCCTPECRCACGDAEATGKRPKPARAKLVLLGLALTRSLDVCELRASGEKGHQLGCVHRCVMAVRSHPAGVGGERPGVLS